MIFPRVLNVDVALVGPQDSNAPRVYAPSWMQRPMEAVRYMPSVATAQPSVPQAITQLQLPQGWVKSREEKNHPGRYVSATNWPTLPETNMAPENRPLEKEIPIGNHQF